MLTISTFLAAREIYRYPLLQIDQDRCVAFALTERKVIHTKDAWGGSLLILLGANETRRAPGIGSDHRWEPFGENLPRTL